MMKLAVGFNPVLPAAELAKVAAKAERSGYDSIFVHESLYQRDVVTYLSCALNATHTLKAGSGAVNTFTRHPVTLATTFASLSELSGGRVILGLGLGSFPTIPLIGHRIFPVKETRPLKRMREYVHLLRAIWAGGKVNFSGDFFTVKDLELGFKPVNKIPLFIASLSPMTLRFAGMEADGAILSPTLSTVEGTEKMLRSVREGEASSDRSITKASYMMTSLDRDVRQAREAIRGFYFFIYQLSEVVPAVALEKYGVKEEALKPMKEAWKRGDIGEAKRQVPDAAIDALAVTGSPDQAMERVREYAKVGVDLPILMPIGNVEYAMEAMAPIGKTV